ncbi:SH3 domain-binding glutamic acid-rich-like protein 3 [Bagarius yarrelli]|uniref:SH3 domain-binding glutamic acid-rich-like protein 3 n=1 Tax=Bagarius yarrelli TaxID=175774 RepID=A0A556UYT0_BAGYA|nr:SH3 domain-binding glutamic acid-rich-like protein 3 [Bagarius yarrelli]
MTIVVYISSAGGSREIKKQQEAILQYLQSKNIKYFEKDVTESSEIKEEMRKKAGNPKALPPQVFNGDHYCGDYQAFFDAVEDGKADKFFKL